MGIVGWIDGLPLSATHAFYLPDNAVDTQVELPPLSRAKQLWHSLIRYLRFMLTPSTMPEMAASKMALLR